MFVFRSFSSPLDSPDASCQKVRSCGYQSFWITSSGSQTLWGVFLDMEAVTIGGLGSRRRSLLGGD